MTVCRATTTARHATAVSRGAFFAGGCCSGVVVPGWCRGGACLLPGDQDSYGDSALIEAAYGGHAEVATILVAAGADVNHAHKVR